MEQVNLKKEFFAVLRGLGYVAFVITVISVLHLKFWEIFLFITFCSLCMRLYGAIRYKKEIKLKDVFKNMASLLLILTFFKFLFKYLTGTIGFIVGCLIIAGLIIFRRRKKWLEVKWKIESMLFGSKIKDLPKDYWKK